MNGNANGGGNASSMNINVSTPALGYATQTSTLTQDVSQNKMSVVNGGGGATGTNMRESRVVDANHINLLDRLSDLVHQRQGMAPPVSHT